jgi:hypothetical protein
MPATLRTLGIEPTIFNTAHKCSSGPRRPRALYAVPVSASPGRWSPHARRPVPELQSRTCRVQWHQMPLPSPPHTLTLCCLGLLAQSSAISRRGPPGPCRCAMLPASAAFWLGWRPWPPGAGVHAQVHGHPIQGCARCQQSAAGCWG